MTGDDEAPGPARVWSLPALVVLAAAGVLLLTGTVVFLGAVFLQSAPPNAVSQRYQEQLNGVVYPEFEQNWKLFAPDPLQYNISVQARVRTVAGQGDWIDLTARDIAAIRHNPIPSHADQNLLRRAWDFYDGTHDDQHAGTAGTRSELAEQYLKRIALQRLGRAVGGSPIVAVELRSATAHIAPPPWSKDTVATQPQYQELGWWPVTDADYQGLR
ncbi:DUF5819 family protein [Kitasatospora azatica]|uniref:DUF5819 family protein n=1 Tax=Kitasatospora azatica TaxID=58347 RepID=UPI0005692218|nr:DUF5819 family protein [Kitasatospora azatica]